MEPDEDDFLALIKSLPAEDAEKVIDGLVESLSRDEAEAIVTDMDCWENPPWRAELEAKVAEAERVMTARHAREALAKGGRRGGGGAARAGRARRAGRAASHP